MVVHLETSNIITQSINKLVWYLTLVTVFNNFLPQDQVFCVRPTTILYTRGPIFIHCAVCLSSRHQFVLNRLSVRARLAVLWWERQHRRGERVLEYWIGMVGCLWGKVKDGKQIDLLPPKSGHCERGSEKGSWQQCYTPLSHNQIYSQK